MRLCLVDGCARRHDSRGYCSMHASRVRKHGDPLYQSRQYGSPLEVFNRNTPTRGDGCWEWQGARQTSEYGLPAYGLISRQYAHRWAYEHFVGPIPDGLVVRHGCDNPPCVNPAHLTVGSHADNSNDAVRRDRVAHGTRIPQSRLNPDQVREIRRKYAAGGVTYRELAAEYGVGLATIYRAVAREAWKRVA
jgi:hypothetical protein